ncbi:two-component regulator propeller domain-containing protein [Rhodocaloribacter sp.]
MRLHRILPLILLLGGLFRPGFGQRYQFEIYTIEDGLAQSQPVSIYQSRSGYLWIGTFGGGLSRFDGRTFVNFSMRDGLASSVVQGIAEDASGTLWFATSRGVSRYDGVHFSTVDLGIPEQHIFAVMADAAGALWFGTEHQGVVRYDGRTTSPLTTKDGLASETVYALLQTSEGTVWMGTGDGLCRFDGSDLQCFTKADGLPSSVVTELAEDRSGRLWVGTADGLATFDGKDFARITEPVLRGRPIRSLVVDRADRVWVGTRQGLFSIDGDRVEHYSKSSGLPQNIWGLYEDREGNLWIGLDGVGIARFSRSPFVLFNEEHGLATNGVWSMLEDRQGRIWFGTDGGGLSRYDGETFTTFTTADGLVDNTVIVSMEDEDGVLWFGTTRGLSRYDGRRFTTFYPDSLWGDVWALASDGQGALWVGTANNGLFRFEDGRVEHFTAKDGLPSEQIYFLHFARDGVLWIATRKGLAQYAGGHFTTYTTADGLGYDEVSFITEDGDGQLWVGTYGGGLTHFIPPGRPGGPHFRNISVEDGLNDDHIMSMVFDAGDNLWACTNLGLNRLDVPRFKVTGEVSIAQYGVAEGFAGRECNSGSVLRDSRERLWFGTVKGVTQYTPGQQFVNPYEPRTHIAEVRLFFGKVDWAPYAEGIEAGSALPVNLRLPYDKNSITFDYVGINLTQPREVSYQYQLVGADETWTPVTRETSATYANLPPGRYTFRVRAANGSSVWNSTPTSFSFVITPPFWRTVWFYLLAGLFVLGSGYAFVLGRERKLRQNQQRLEEKVAIRTHELREEKEKVEAVNEQLKLLSLVARETDNIVIIADASGRIEWINEALTRIVGYTLETLRRHVGETLKDVYRNPELEAAMQRAVEEGASSVFESKIRRADGTEIWVSSTLSPIQDERGRVEKLVIIDTDITRQKMLEQELVDAREAALEAARTKSDFLANMSHEIRTPMNGVIGMTSLLLDTELTPEQLEFVQVIRNSGDTLLAIINDILDFSKIEAGKIELEEQAFELHEVVEEALELVATKAAEKGLELAHLIEDDVPVTVRGDVTRVRQVLINLLSNAVKFTDRGEVVVLLDAEPTEAARCRIHVAVRDTGVGIPADRLDRLFESFSQVDASTTRKYGGSGLGLAISKRLVELMGGTMWVESEEGVGSTFHFNIEVEALPPGSRMEGRLPGVEALAGKRILIVDDNLVNRRMLTLQLGRWDMKPTAAATGQEALARIDAGERFDVALLDMQMPGMDGIMLATELRRRTPTASLPIIILSSMGQRAHHEDLDLVAWLTKPIKKRRLLNTLLSALQPGARPAIAARAGTFDAEMAKRQPLRILIAEDNAVNQKVIRQFLERMGYVADAVANGLEVLDALRQSRYDVVLMDVQMPEMDGLEATRRIREDYGPDRQPYIVAITANATHKDREVCLDVGMDDYISKPVRVPELEAALARCRKSADAVAQPERAGEPEPERAEDASAADETPLNLSRLEEATGDDPVFMREVLKTYLIDTPNLIDALWTAYAADDMEGLARAAHSLKSSSRTCGADHLAELSRKIEAKSRTGEQVELLRLVEEAADHFVLVRRAMEARIGGADRRAGADRRPRGFGSGASSMADPV